MQTQIARWGNSLAVRIPQPLAREISLVEGAAVDIEVEYRRIVLRPRPAEEPSLADLLARITPENLPDETFDNAPVGREAL